MFLTSSLVEIKGGGLVGDVGSLFLLGFEMLSQFRNVRKSGEIIRGSVLSDGLRSLYKDVGSHNGRTSPECGCLRDLHDVAFFGLH